MWFRYGGIIVAVEFLTNQRQGAAAFTSRGRRSTMKMDVSSFLGNIPGIPNPFGGSDDGKQSTPPPPPSAIFSEFDPSPEGLVARAKIVLAADLGVQDDSLLDDDFVWLGPTVGSSVLGKQDFVAAGKFFDLRAAFPDLDYRAHDFRVDVQDPLTVRFTARTIGTMRGELRLRNTVLSPNGKLMQCPPESISITFDGETGKVTKLCSGFTMDRLVGNTNGLCGVMAAATIGGAPPSDWEIYPPTAVVGRILGRPVQQLPDPGSFLAPFPESVMIQLTKGIFAAGMASMDPDLLGPSFTYCEPFEGPVGKDEYLDKFAAGMFGDSEPELSNFRVDPYDPYRVWVDVRPLNCPPQAMSFTFDDDGFCIRLTGAAVMDPSVGNAGGLGGAAGIKYASGEADAGLVSRPLPQVLARLRKQVLAPITKIGVDDYTLTGEEDEAADEALVPKPPDDVPPTPLLSPLAKLSSPKLGSGTTAAVPPTAAAPDPAAARKAELRAKAAQEAEMRRQEAAEKRAMIAEAKAKEIALRQQKAQELKAKSDAERQARVAQQKAAAAEARAQQEAQLAESKRRAEAARLEKEQKRAQELSARAKAQKERMAKMTEKRKKAEAERKQRAKEEAEARQKAAAVRAAAIKRAATKPPPTVQDTASAFSSVFGARPQPPPPAPKPVAKRTAAPKPVAKIAPVPKPTPITSGGGFSLFGAGSAKSTPTTPRPSPKKVTLPKRSPKVAPAPMTSPKASSGFSLFGGPAPKSSPSPAPAKMLAKPVLKRATPPARPVPKRVPPPPKPVARKAPPPPKPVVKKAPPPPKTAAKKAPPPPKPVAKKVPPGKAAPKPAKKSPPPPPTTAPRGVPTLKNWRKNRDGSVTGLITGSRQFEENEKITTSPIASGGFKKGSVVQTESGSKYFLG